jgi:hypothetical protein
MGTLPGTVPDLVEEPISGSLLPVTLDDDSSSPPKVLLGFGVRVKRFAMIDIQIYALSVYGQHDEVFGSSDIDDSDMPVCSPVSSGKSEEQLMHKLLSSPAEKVVCLTFLRSITGKQAFDGLSEGLVKIGGAPKEEVEELKNHIPLQIPKASELRFVVKPQLGEVRFRCSVVPDGERSLMLPGVCQGVHNVYFGPQSIIQGLGTSLLRQRPLNEARYGIDRCNSGQSTAGSFSYSESDPGDSPARERNQPRSEAEGGLTTISSGVQLDSLAKEKQADTGSSIGASTKANVGNAHGVEDSAALVNACLNQNSQILPGEVEPWPGALMISMEESVQPWIVLPDVSDFNEAKLRSQSIQGIFYKHHTSSIRGALAPKWTTRYYELQSGVLRYRRRASGKYCGEISLDGARVVAEGPKVSRLGECFIFRVIVKQTTAVMLSSPDKNLVTEWVHAIAGACAFYRARRCIAAGVLFANGNSDGSGQRDMSDPPGTSPSVNNSSFSEGSQQRQVQAAQQLPVSSASPVDTKPPVVAVSFSEESQQQRQVQAAQQLPASSVSPVVPRNLVVAVTPQRALPWRRIGLSVISALLVLLLVRRRRRVQR